jgi:hypothetical protein
MKTFMRLISVLTIMIAMTACSSSKPAGTSSVTISMTRQSAAKTAGIMQAAPTSLSGMRITVSSADFNYVYPTVSVPSGGGTVEDTIMVPNGSARTFLVEILDNNGIPAYSGSTIADLNGEPISLSINASTILFFANTQMIGTSYNDDATALARDASGSFIMAGTTYGDLASANADSTHATSDVFVAKFDVSSALVWSIQFGTATTDIANGVATDNSGNIYVAGGTDGALFGEINNGLSDAFVTKFTTTGLQLWTRLSGSTNNDYANAVAVDGAGYSYVATSVVALVNVDGAPMETDCFVLKYDPNGTLLWSSEIGTSDGFYPDTECEAIAIDNGGNVYATGFTTASLFSQNADTTGVYPLDIFAVRLNSSSGALVNGVQIGSIYDDQAWAIAVDRNRIYIAGDTYGDLASNNSDSTHATSDMFLLQLDSNLVQLKAWQFGTPGSDTVDGIAVDSYGNILMAGSTTGAFPGFTNAGVDNTVALKFDPVSGTITWAQQVQSTIGVAQSSSFANALVLDQYGNVIIAGSANGIFEGLTNFDPSGYTTDAFLMSYSSSGVKQ